MKNQIAVLPSLCRTVGRWITASAMALAIIVPATALPSFADSGISQQLIPILGLTTDNRAIGTVAYLALSFEERSDRSGLIVHFQNGPGRFSRMAQTSTAQGDLADADWSTPFLVQVSTVRTVEHAIHTFTDPADQRRRWMWKDPSTARPQGAAVPREGQDER